MKRPQPGRIPGRQLRWAIASLAALSFAAGAPASDRQYIVQDARISGTRIHVFEDSGEQVSVVLGGFQLTIGQRVLSGTNAVVWIRSGRGPQSLRHDITAYIEGDARFVQPGLPVTRDDAMLVELRQHGRLIAEGQMVDRPLKESKLYRRALAGRRAAATRATQPAGQPATKPAEPSAQPVTTRAVMQPVAGAPVKPTTKAPTRTPPAPVAAATASPATRPAEASAAEAALKPTAPEPPKIAKVRPAKELQARRGGKTSGRSKPAVPAKPRVVLPVSFRADGFTSEQQGNERVTVAKGNVYLSQGSPDSVQFVEMRSQVAVLFSGPGVKKDTTSPFSAELAGAAMPGGAGETITGVYLDGDVVIARGERYLRGSSAYYDFTTDRAYVLDPVFRTVQEQRNIPIYIRASEARALSAREIWFRNATASTSDFYNPEWSVRASRVYLMDNTPYDPETGEPLGEQAWRAKMTDTTFRLGRFPVFYLPKIEGDFEQGNSALRTAQVGSFGNFGTGVETEWHLFRLLGLLEPEGVNGKLEFDYYEKGAVAGIDLDYARRDFRGNQYSGYSLLYGVYDRQGEDNFGDEREDIEAPHNRGRALVRHKHYLPNDWQLQFELSYICDRNFLESYFRDEFYAGKEQDTLLYAKKQRDNWAFTTLAQVRINRFLTQTESAPDLGAHWIGEPLLDDKLTLYSESHAGLKRFRPANDLPGATNRFFTRFDTRQELDLPLAMGPLNVVPYAVGRATYWDARPSENGDKCRPYGQVGVKANTHVWRVYDGVESRLWDVHRLKHVITPEAIAWLAGTKVSPDNLFPMDPDIEEHLTRASGAGFAVRQRLQTKRGRPGSMRTVDWMRLNLGTGFFDNGGDRVPADGRLFMSRPEYSIARNFVNADYTWNISDSTALLSDANYDIDDKEFGKANIGLAVERDPRLRYYFGTRFIDDLDSAVGTFGVNYKLSEKYSISVFEQYDFKFEDGKNLVTSVTLTRKFPRWYGAFTFTCDPRSDDVAMYITFWPEGVPEVKLGGQRVSVLSRSDKN